MTNIITVTNVPPLHTFFPNIIIIIGIQTNSNVVNELLKRSNIEKIYK